MNLTATKNSENVELPAEKNAGTPSITLISSRNIVGAGGKVHFAADLTWKDGEKKALTPEWSVEPKLQGISIDKNGILTVAPEVINRVDTVLIVKATFEGKSRTKKITLTPKDPHQNKSRVHYFRYDGRTFSGWNVWSWTRDTEGKQYDFEESTDFGKMAATDRDYFLIRYQDWKAKETGDIHIGKNEDIFIVESDTGIFRSFRDAVTAARPKILVAFLDSKTQAVAYLTNSPGANTVFTLYADNEPVSSATTENRKLVIPIPKDYKINPSSDFEIRASRSFEPGRVLPRRILDSFVYNGDDMGTTFTADKINLRLWAPTSAAVSAMVYGDYDAPDSSGEEHPMKRDPAGNGTWLLSLDKTKNYGKFLKYKLDFYPGTQYAKTNYAVDPYAEAVSVNGAKAALIDIKNDPETKFEGWKPDKKPFLRDMADSVLYELHVRDFSMDENSGINPEYMGKYLAFTQTGATHPQDKQIKTGIDHLTELGITHVHLLPVYDFASVDESRMKDPKSPHYNWGYDPRCYNVPEGSYSTDPFNPKCRIKEFRQMVQSLHDHKIRVVMDVVYNHTIDTSVFDSVVPGYYYRSDPFGNYTNGSGCGNEVASERPMIRKFIVDSVKHWATDYNIDGFRFDLMGIIDTETVKEVVKELRKINPTIIVYGEPWSGGGTSLPGEMQTYKGKQCGNRFAVFNDNMRNAIRGDNGVPFPSKGYANGNTGEAGKVLSGVIGSISDFTINPEETINYAAAHDNYCLWDQTIASSGHLFPNNPYIPKRMDYSHARKVIDDNRIKRALLANGIILTSQGIPFILAGDEILRTKFGDHNSYKSPDAINMIRWDWKRDYYMVFKYYQGLIKLRREHPAFRMTSSAQIKSHLDVLPAPGDVIAYILYNHANGDRWRNIIVIYNPHIEVLSVNIPPGDWTVVVDDQNAGTKPIPYYTRTFSGTVTVPELSITVLYDVDEVTRIK